MTSFDDVRSAIVCLTDGRMLATEAADLVAAYADERIAAERERTAVAIEALIPDLHREDEECVDCWALRRAAAIAREGGESS